MNTFLQALLMGLIGAAATSVGVALHLPIWVLFICWVSYYVFGQTPKAAALTLAQQLLGLVLAVVMQTTGLWLSAPLGRIGFPLAVTVFIGALYYVSKARVMNVLPAYFTGLIIWFSMQAEPQAPLLLRVLGTMVLGYCFAWFNDYLHRLLARRGPLGERKM